MMMVMKRNERRRGEVSAIDSAAGGVMKKMETNWWPSCSTGSSNEPATWQTKSFQIRGNQSLVSCAFDSFHL